MLSMHLSHEKEKDPKGVNWTRKEDDPLCALKVLLPTNSVGAVEVRVASNDK